MQHVELTRKISDDVWTLLLSTEQLPQGVQRFLGALDGWRVVHSRPYAVFQDGDFIALKFEREAERGITQAQGVFKNLPSSEGESQPDMSLIATTENGRDWNLRFLSFRPWQGEVSLGGDPPFKLSVTFKGSDPRSEWFSPFIDKEAALGSGRGSIGKYFTPSFSPPVRMPTEPLQDLKEEQWARISDQMTHLVDRLVHDLRMLNLLVGQPVSCVERDEHGHFLAVRFAGEGLREARAYLRMDAPKPDEAQCGTLWYEMSDGSWWSVSPKWGSGVRDLALLDIIPVRLGPVDSAKNKIIDFFRRLT